MAVYKVVKNEKKGSWCPWELLKDGEAIDSFSSEEIAKERMKLLKEVHEVIKK